MFAKFLIKIAICSILLLAQLDSAFATQTVARLPDEAKNLLCEPLLRTLSTSINETLRDPQMVAETLIRLYPAIIMIGAGANPNDPTMPKFFSPTPLLYSPHIQDLLHDFAQTLTPDQKQILAPFFTTTPYLSDKALREYFEKTNIPKRVGTLKEAELISQHLGIIQTESFLDSPERIRLELLNEVFRELRKIPPIMRLTIERAGRHLDLVTGSVTSHPDLGHLRGVRPRGWSEGSTWDHVPGLSDVYFRAPSVIAADHLTSGHDSINLILHEHAHTFDTSAGELLGPSRLSHRSDFIALHKKYKWPTDYEDTYIVEAFAESAARYLHSPQTKQALREAMPDVYEYFKKLFQN